MPGRLRETLLAAVIAVVLTGCGSDEDGSIPQEDADILIGQLDAVEQAVASADCDLAQEHVNEFVANVDLLPADVGVETKTALREAGTNLGNIAADQCEPAVAEEPETETEPTTTEETEPATTTTTTTEETTTEETTTEEEPPTEEETTTEEEPPASDQGAGGGEPPSGGLEPGGEGEGR